MRIGAKKKPFYRVVAVDERNKRDGAYIELLGTYNPLTEPKDIKLKQDRIDHWIKMGAQMSTGFLRIIGKAPQRAPRKPKKEKKEPSVASLKPSEPTVEAPAPEAPKEESQSISQSDDLQKTEEQTPAEIAEISTTEDNEKKEVVDDSVDKSQSTESDTPESVQNKKNEGSA